MSVALKAATTTGPSLTQADLNYLKTLSDAGKRSEYYAYLESKGDRYGKLAGDVVNHSSYSGRLANAFMAESAAWEGVIVDEKKALEISKDLMNADFEARQSLLDQKKTGELDYEIIRDYHKAVFDDHKIGIGSWTAEVPLKMYGRYYKELGYSSPKAAQAAIWEKMLNGEVIETGFRAMGAPLGDVTIDKYSLKEVGETALTFLLEFPELFRDSEGVEWALFVSMVYFDELQYVHGAKNGSPYPPDDSTAPFRNAYDGIVKILLKASSYGENCFPSSTPITLADGTEKPIEQIQVGDLVRAIDPATGAFLAKPVVRLFRNVTQEWLELHFEDGRPPLVATPGHHFYDPALRRYRALEEMEQEGKVWIQEASGSVVEAQVHHISYSAETSNLFEEARFQAVAQGNLAVKEPPKGWQSYNFEVADVHNYVAGGIRVHNLSQVTLFTESDYKNNFLVEILEDTGVLKEHGKEISIIKEGDQVLAVLTREGVPLKHPDGTQSLLTDFVDMVQEQGHLSAENAISNAKLPASNSKQFLNHTYYVDKKAA